MSFTPIKELFKEKQIFAKIILVKLDAYLKLFTTILITVVLNRTNQNKSFLVEII